MKAILGNWTTARAAIAVAGALAIAGAVGSAIAMSPIVQPPIKWAGGAEFDVFNGAGLLQVYVVPAGRNLILTDLVFGNRSGTTVSEVTVSSSPVSNCQGQTTDRIHFVVAPYSTTVANLQTGIGFTSGHRVCIFASQLVSMSGRGFLFTAAPAS